MTLDQTTDMEVTSPLRVGVTAAGRRAWAVGAIVVVLALAACGSSSPSSAPPATTAAGGSSGSASGTSASASGSTTTVPPTTTSTSAAPSGGKGGSFCRLARKDRAIVDGQLDLSDPAKVRRIFTRINNAEPALIALAPAAIKGDLSKLDAAENRLRAILEKANYNFDKVSPANAKTIERDGRQTDAPSKVVDAYLTKTCGLKTS
jgi:hypothetical protein